MRAHPPNTSQSAVVARSARSAGRPRRWATSTARAALASLLAGAALICLVACGGGGSPSAASLVSDTFRSRKPIESGRIDLSFTLAPTSSTGSLAAVRPLALRLRGPFQSASSTGMLPSFALTLTLMSAGNTLHAGATSTSGQLFIELAGASFQAPDATVHALQQGYAQATRTSSSAASQSTFAALGVDPGEWLVNPRIVGPVTIAGTETIHVTAALNVASFVADAEKLSSAGGALGLGAAGAGGLGLLSPSGISTLSSSVHGARVDVYTGAHDHLLRRLSLTGAIVTTPQTRAELGGLGSASLRLVLQFAGLNEPQRILAPSNPQPISQLLPALERLGLALAPASPGISG